MSKSVQDVIDTIISQIPGAPRDGTVDTIKTGDPSQPVTGIVTTFLATHAVLKQTVDLGANLIITHEPTFYNHLDEVDWLGGDPVYAAKRQFIDENNLVVWRFHDYWHMHRPDGIMTGVRKALGWNAAVDEAYPPVFDIQAMALDDLAVFLKEKLGIGTLRIVGEPETVCRRVCFAVGAGGGRSQIHGLSRKGIDVIVCGEINEWETCEYARDAVLQGQNKALIVLGHANSEEAGMRWLVEWLTPLVPDVSITHVPAGDPFRFL
ncbi:MAG: Nif3-like dinuclear metal center hexameric protein [Anaerolineae bacterium]|nr:Nif3-like dinuclear metal center hexameric protein [Anaerolineae bacterium]